jgi:hypothetical protein
MRHQRLIAAPPARVFAALRTADLAGSGLVKLLVTIRTLRIPKGPLTLDSLIHAGFKLVGERPGEEIVLGVVGKFWKPSGERRPADEAQFGRGAPPGEVLVAWSFEVAKREEGKHPPGHGNPDQMRRPRHPPHLPPLLAAGSPGERADSERDVAGG